METQYQLDQDINFINRIRSLVTDILASTDTSPALLQEKNTLFGDASRLTSEAFIDENEGLVKTDIMTALDVLISINDLLNTGSNRGYLETVRSPKIKPQ